ncbi:MAG: nitroreductase family deazaflavin-dependent oxidoreductase [Chloroflexi bacterium]|nr:MAG: nitroreductase family deazaflavin-dependent oxidoreductase [Chloroflexota bacterium]TMG32582.1 MAG: nitroreductase family deazaflavin-dependent oxidoreductase [Chloroflexota bacterium]
MSNSFNDFNQALISDLRANGGRASGGPFKGGDVLILTTTGAKTGAPRENPLAFSKDDGNYVVVASKGGAPTNPAWYHNLRANPIVKVEALGETFEARARVIDGEQDYERLYREHARKMPGFNEYRQRTSRRIPVIVLERADSEDAA